MSNGSRSCPSVTLPFGVFPASPTIAPLDETDFPTAEPLPRLEDFILGNSPFDATPFDGFDTAFTEAVDIVGGLDSALGTLAGQLGSTFAEADTIDAGPVGDTVAGFAAALEPSSTAADNLGLLLGSVSTPAPPSGPGQLVSVPTATGPVLACTGTFDFAVQQGQTLPFTGRLTVKNDTAKPVTISKVTLVEPADAHFTATTDCMNAPIQPGASCTIELTLTAADPPGESVQLQIESDGPVAVLVACVGLRVVPLGGESCKDCGDVLLT